jgi:hypothetical protein
MKGVKNIGDVFGWNANTAIADLKTNLLLIKINFKINVGTKGRIFNRITQ